ncbi:MAG: DUF736 family protein [Candidatus Roizmanbacteria bacterium]
MLQIKNFSIFRVKEQKNDKSPTHRLSCKIGEEYISIGSAWTKETKTGDKFLSVKLSDIFTDHTDNTKSRKGIVLVYEDDLKELAKLAGVSLTPEATTKPPEPHISDNSPF